MQETTEKCHTSTPKSDKKTSLKLKSYQETICQKVILEQTDCLLVWPTSSGKTHTVFNLIKRMEKAAILIIPTLALLIDMCKYLEKYNISFRALSSVHCTGSGDKLEESLLCEKPKVQIFS